MVIFTNICTLDYLYHITLEIILSTNLIKVRFMNLNVIEIVNYFEPTNKWNFNGEVDFMARLRDF